jgi:hypothetical protein
LPKLLLLGDLRRSLLTYFLSVSFSKPILRGFARMIYKFNSHPNLTYTLLSQMVGVFLVSKLTHQGGTTSKQ